MILQPNLSFWIIFTLLLVSARTPASFKMEIPEGFLWYRERLDIEEKKDKTALPSKKPKTAQEKHDDLRKSFEEAVHIALDDPSIENVKKAQKLQQELINKSEAFSKAWMVAALDIDGIQDPTLSANPLYIKLKEKERTERRKKSFKDLSKTYGIFYLFDEKCRYCHHFFPIVLKFCETYGFEMIAVSRSGTTLPYAGSKPKVTFMRDNGIIKRLNTKEIFPAVFLANLKSEAVIPLSWGMGTITELEDNLERAVLYHTEQVRKKR